MHPQDRPLDDDHYGPTIPAAFSKLGDRQRRPLDTHLPTKAHVLAAILAVVMVALVVCLL